MPFEPPRTPGKKPPPPASPRRSPAAVVAGAPAPSSSGQEKGGGLVWLLAPHPGRIRAMSFGSGGTLGRGEEAVLRVDAPGVAPSHARIELVPRESAPPEVYVTDLGSPGGTHVSGMRAQRTILSDGDLLRLGSAIALVVERDIASFEGVVVDEGGLVRGPRSRRGWFSAVEKLMSEAPNGARRTLVIAGSPGSGRGTVARRIAEAWGAPAQELDLRTLEEDPADRVGHAATHGSLVLRNLTAIPLARQLELARVLEVRRTLPLFTIVDEPTLLTTLPRELVGIVGNMVVTIPSLEQRREEIPSIIRARFEKHGVAANRLSIELYESLTRAAWPGEIAELCESVDHIAAAHPDVPRLGPEHLVHALSRRGGRSATRATAEATDEAVRIRAALDQAKGSVAAAARALHLSRQALYREAARLGIDIRRSRESNSAA